MICRSALVGLFLALLALPAGAQSARVGLLGPDEQPRFSEIAGGLRQGLREQGYGEGKVEIVEIRTARGEDASRAAVAKLNDQRFAALFVIGSNLAGLARDKVPALPIVFITPGDPVAAGLVASFARPGKNMTAMTFEYPELSAKRLELLRDVGPRLVRVPVLYDARDASPRQGVAAARAAAAALGITLIERQVTNAEEITRGLTSLNEADALLGVPGGVTTGHDERMIDAANSKRRPSIFHTRTESTRHALL